MGVELTVSIPAGRVIAWPDVAARLAARGMSAPIRMIDGLPAFPDEAPPDDWSELRVGTPGGMVTLRRTAVGVTCVAWGTDDPGLRRDFRAVAQAVAEATGGTVNEAGT